MAKTRKPTEVRRREIIDAAIKIIGDRGLQEFTAAQLACEVGITDGTIFRHFKDKREISLAVMDKLEELIETATRFSGDPLERLGKFVMSQLHSVAVQPEILSLIFSDNMSHALGTDGPRRVAAIRNRGREFMRACLREAAENHLIREDIDIESEVLCITGMVISFLFAAKDGALSAPVEEMEKSCEQTLHSILNRMKVTP